MSAAERMATDEAAEWFVQILIEAANRQGKPLTNEQIWILKHPISDFSDDIREAVIATNNRGVELIRKIIRSSVAEGKPSMKVRQGLWVPNYLEEQYELLYVSEHPWFICAVLQNVFLGNPMQGEKGIWTPNNKPPATAAEKHQTPKQEPNLYVADKHLLKQQTTKSRGNKIWFFTVLAVLLLIVFVGCTRAITSSSETATYSDTESVEEPVDAGAPIPGDYYDDGEFAWQWVSSPTCEAGTICSQVRVFSKYECPYEVWIDWEHGIVGSSDPTKNRTAIPPMMRGETGIATLSTKSGMLDFGQTENSVLRITCGQTG